MAKITPAKPFLLMMYGFPGAGKTHFARQLSEKMQIAHIHADRIRAELFEKPRYDKQENEVVLQLMNYMAGEFLAAGLSVIYDTSMIRANARRNLREMTRNVKAQPVLMWFQIDPETSFQRTQKRDRRRLDDKFAMPIDRRMFDAIAGHMQNPGLDEEYAVVSGKHLFNTQYAGVSRLLRDKGLIKHEDAAAHLAKPELVNLVPNPLAGRVDMSRRNINIQG